MDPIGIACSVALAAAALYRTLAGHSRNALTAGLWTAAAGVLVCAIVPSLDPPLRSATGLANLSQPISYTLMVASSYLVARFTYQLARLASQWPLGITIASVVGTNAIYATTSLSKTPVIAIDTTPGAASAWYAAFFAAGLLPTHIAALVGASRTKRPSTKTLAWLLYAYGAIGALFPLLIVADHIGTNALNWPLDITYPLISVWLLISWGALAIAGVIGARRPAPEPANI